VSVRVRELGKCKNFSVQTRRSWSG